MTRITISLQPVTKKNSQQIHRNKRTGKRFIAQSEKYRTYEKAAGYYIRWQGEPIDYPVNVQMVYFMKDRHRVDLVNLQEATLDILVTWGVLKDDNYKIVATMDGSRVEVDRANPRTEITITRKETEDE